MNEERLQREGRLAVLKRQVAELELSMRGDLTAIRLLLDPHEDLENIKAAEAAVQAVELSNKHAEYLKKQAQIKAIEES
jgi:small-conductance mechanosensitive channel